MQLVNLTPHPLVLKDAEGRDTVVAPNGTIARVAMIPGVLETVEGCPVPVMGKDTLGGIEGLPAPEAGTMYIVSGFVGSAVSGRDDVLVPGTGPKDGCVRNERGHIVAVTCLKRC